MASKPRGESAPNEFDAAKSIVDILTGLEKVQQERVLRFASEALGLTSPSSFQTPASSTHIQSRSSVIATPTSVSRSSDIKQFTEMKSPKSDQQFAAVAAYYYKFEAAPEDRNGLHPVPKAPS
jgi:hypothetical protein